MTPYERYLTRQALAVEIERVVDSRGRVSFRPRQQPAEISRLQSIKESEFSVLERHEASGTNAATKHKRELL